MRLRSVLIVVHVAFLSSLCITPSPHHFLTGFAEAAVSESENKQIQSGETNQGGGVTTSTSRQLRGVIGRPFSSAQLSGSRYRLVPGVLGASTSAASAKLPISTELELTVLYAKTDSLGAVMTPGVWQKDTTPIFIWEPPPLGVLLVAGYSYQLDGEADETIDTSSTSFDVALAAPPTLADGKHAFSVRAVNSGGDAGPAISMELWVDQTPPAIGPYTPAPGTLLKTPTPLVTASPSDAASGVDPDSIVVMVNGGAITTQWNATTGQLTATGGTWKEGLNNLELRLADLAGNSVAPLLWSITADTTPPTGSITVNAGSALTTSVYVTLTLAADDATSGVAKMMLSNDASIGYIEEPYATSRQNWKLNPVRGQQTVHVKFVDAAGNVSAVFSDAIELLLLSPETLITSGPAGFTLTRDASFTFMCPEEECVFSFAFDNENWSPWAPEMSASKTNLSFGNHYFRVKAAKEVNGTPEIQVDEEDPSPAERTWIIGVESPAFIGPQGPPVKVWRIE